MKPTNQQLQQLYVYVSSFTHADSVEELWQVIDYPYLQQLLMTEDNLAIQDMVENVYEQHKVAAFTVPIFFDEEISNVYILAEGPENPFKDDIRVIIDSLGLQNLESYSRRITERTTEFKGENDINKLNLNDEMVKIDSKSNESIGEPDNELMKGQKPSKMTRDSKKVQVNLNIKTGDKKSDKKSDNRNSSIDYGRVTPEHKTVDNTKEGAKERVITDVLQLQRFTHPLVVNASTAALPAATTISNINVLTKALTMPSKKKRNSMAQKLNFMRIRRKSDSPEFSDIKASSNVPGSIDQQLSPKMAKSKINRRTSVVEDQLPMYIRQQIQDAASAHSIIASSRVKSIISNSNSFYAVRQTNNESRDESRDASQGSTSEISGDRNISDDDREYILPTLISRYMDYDDEELADIDFVNLSHEEEENDEDDDDELLFK